MRPGNSAFACLLTAALASCAPPDTECGMYVEGVASPARVQQAEDHARRTLLPLLGVDVCPTLRGVTVRAAYREEIHHECPPHSLACSSTVPLARQTMWVQPSLYSVPHEALHIWEFTEEGSTDFEHTSPRWKRFYEDRKASGWTGVP